MGCEMEIDQSEEMDIALSSMWPEDINEAGRQFNVERPGADQDMLEEVTFNKEPKVVDFQRLMELTYCSDKGNGQLSNLIKNWEYKQENAVRLLREELDSLNKQQQEFELKKLEILEEHRFEKDGYGDNKRPISILDDDLKYVYQDVPKRRKDVVLEEEKVEIDGAYDSVVYWKQRALHFEKLLDASLKREQVLIEKLEESIENLEKQSTPVEELAQVLKRADNFLHFVLQNAPVVIGHQDKELRYRFIFNHFPSLREEEIIGKTDVEIFTGSGVKESQDFKQEVLEQRKPAKREITFTTELFGSKTFLIYVEPVFSKAGETIGVNYMGMEITDQVRKREKMAKLREEMAVQKAKETELTKTIHIQDESMRAKQMLATMSHEIRSPLSGVVSMAEILFTTKLDKEQKQLLKIMLSSGDLVLQLINDILDLSKVESGVMKLEAAKFRPREVVQHVLQTAAASLQKILTLEGHITDDVPIEVIGDVLRLRQILTNLISNAIKFTHEGKVGVKLYVVPEPQKVTKQGSQRFSSDQPTNTRIEASISQFKQDQNGTCGHIDEKNDNPDCEPSSPMKNGAVMEEKATEESVVWIVCDVYDTGIGIPENAMTTLFKKYMQVGADTARKYGGTGLGLAICKQLVELMGGNLSVSSVENQGSTFTFILPYKVSSFPDNSEDPDYLSDTENQYSLEEDNDILTGTFVFHPRTLGSLFSSQSSERIQKLSPSSSKHNILHKCNGFLEDTPSPSSNVTQIELGSEEDSSLAADVPQHEISFCQSKKEQNHSNINGHFDLHSPSTSRSSDNLDGTSIDQREIQSDRISECSTSNSPEITKAITKAKQKPRILLVEDNKINVMVAKSMMKKFGHTIDVVNNGAEAVQAVQRYSYDLVLMDVCMPVMDGLQATRLIRSFEETGSWDDAVQAGIELQVSSSHCVEKTRKRLPIVAMTANSVLESADECYANGMDSFVSKPINFQSLERCLQQYIDKQHL